MHNGRIVPRRSRGILKSLKKKATFWTGRTAQRIVAERLQQNTKDKEAKRIARQQSRVTRSSRNNAAPATLVPKELRRLERALKRRKTLEARQRIAARIAELKRELAERPPQSNDRGPDKWAVGDLEA